MYLGLLVPTTWSFHLFCTFPSCAAYGCSSRLLLLQGLRFSTMKNVMNTAVVITCNCFFTTIVAIVRCHVTVSAITITFLVITRGTTIIVSLQSTFFALVLC